MRDDIRYDKLAKYTARAARGLIGRGHETNIKFSGAIGRMDENGKRNQDYSEVMRQVARHVIREYERENGATNSIRSFEQLESLAKDGKIDFSKHTCSPSTKEVYKMSEGMIKEQMQYEKGERDRFRHYKLAERASIVGRTLGGGELSISGKDHKSNIIFSEAIRPEYHGEVYSIKIAGVWRNQKEIAKRIAKHAIKEYESASGVEIKSFDELEGLAKNGKIDFSKYECNTVDGKEKVEKVSERSDEKSTQKANLEPDNERNPENIQKTVNKIINKIKEGDDERHEKLSKYASRAVIGFDKDYKSNIIFSKSIFGSDRNGMAFSDPLVPASMIANHVIKEYEKNNSVEIKSFEQLESLVKDGKIDFSKHTCLASTGKVEELKGRSDEKSTQKTNLKTDNNTKTKTVKNKKVRSKTDDDMSYGY